MSDQNERAKRSEDRSARKGTAMPDCCGPMVEQMFKAFREGAPDSSAGSSAQNSETDTAAACASAMKWTRSSCCGRPSAEETAAE